jgi:hypothetical protein
METNVAGNFGEIIDVVKVQDPKVETILDPVAL